MNKNSLGLLICLLISFLSFSNIFQNDFVMDDQNFIVDWPLIRDSKNFGQFFGPQNQPAGEEGVYSPLKTVFHAVNYNLWKDNVFGYHVVALLIHLTSVFFIYRISQLMTKNYLISALAALFFGIHPVHAEAITSMTGSVDTSGVMFLFISFYFYIQNGAKGKTAYYSLSLLFAVLAIFTHELCISLPLLLLFYDLSFSKTKTVESAKRTGPFFVILLVYVSLKFLILGNITRGGYLADSFYLTMLVSVKAIGKYILLLLFPFNLAVNQKISNGIFSVDIEDFDKTAVLTQSFFDKEVLLSIVLIGLVIYGAIKSWKTNRLIGFCVGWFFITLLPVLNIIPTSSYFGERYLYPGSFGFCLMLGILLSNLYERKIQAVKINPKWIGISLIAVVTVFYSLRTYMRNGDWSNELTFYQNEVRVNPDSFMMQHDLGVIYLKYDQPLKAVHHFEQALLIRNDDVGVMFSMAEGYMILGEPMRAIEYLRKAIYKNPQFAEAHYNLAVIYASIGQGSKALGHFDRAMQLYKSQGTTVDVNQARQAFEKYIQE